ncbi:MAG: putative rane protein [Gemmatimonadetes bacterium]|nr:putative rane protein [Gemmatimonadota bacterium]
MSLRQFLSDPAEEPAHRAITRGALVLYAAVALVFFAPAFLPGQQIGGTDYLTGGYYFLEFAMRRIGAGALPKWVPYIFGGLPMYANPGGLFYPVRLLMSALLPVARVMPAVFVVQFALAGIGTHLLVRALGVRHWVALIAGVAFELTGVSISYVYAGHDGRIIVATLSPFVFYFVLSAVRSGELRWFVGLAVTLAFALLSAQIQSTYYLLIAGGLWAAFLLVKFRRDMRGLQLGSRTALGLAAVALAFGVAAVNLLPFSGYIKDSPRAESTNRDYAFSTQFSMPPVETMGMAVPEQAGILGNYHGENEFKLHTEYVGALVVLMLLVGVMLSRRDSTWQFMGGLAAFMLSISYGSHTPLYRLYYIALPGTAKFRSPSIALYLVSLCVVVMAALTLERLARLSADRESSPDVRRLGKAARLLTASAEVSLVGFLIAAGTAVDGSDRALGWARFFIFAWVTAVVLRRLARGTVTLRAATLILLVTTASDLLLIDRHFITTEGAPDTVFAEDDVVHYLKGHTPGRVWVFPFPEDAKAAHYIANGRFGPRSDYLMHFGIAQAGGEHGNQLYRWNQLVGIAKNGNVLDWHNFVEYPAIMEAASIRYILSGVQLQLYDMKTKQGMPGIKEVHNGSAFIYVNNRALGRAQLVPTVRVVKDGGALAVMRTNDWDPRMVAVVEAPAAPFTSPELPPVGPTGPDGLPTSALAIPGSTQIDVDDPDHVEVSVRATAPAMLVLNDNDADGWIATIDGRETPILRTNHAFRGVAVTAGAHKVVFSFRPRLFYTGLWISLAAVLVLGAGVVVALLQLVRTSRSARLLPAAA